MTERVHEVEGQVDGLVRPEGDHVGLMQVRRKTGFCQLAACKLDRRLAAVAPHHVIAAARHLDDQAAAAAARFVQPPDRERAVPSTHRLQKIGLHRRVVAKREVPVARMVVAVGGGGGWHDWRFVA